MPPSAPVICFWTAVLEASGSSPNAVLREAGLAGRRGTLANGVAQLHPAAAGVARAAGVPGRGFLPAQGSQAAVMAVGAQHFLVRSEPLPQFMNLQRVIELLLTNQILLG